MNYFLKITYFTLCLTCMPLKGQNMASIEAPLGISFVYGFDYHPLWYTNLKSTFGFGWGDDYIAGNWYLLQYGFSIEQRYYYNMYKRVSQGKKTFNKSANFISVRPSFTYHQYLNNMLIDRRIYSCPLNWGLRRTIGQRFYFDGSVGVGPAYYTYHKKWSSFFDLHICIGFKLF